MNKNLILVQTLASGGVERVAVNIANNLDNTKVILYEDKIDYECNKEIISIKSGPGKSYISKFFKFLYRIWKIRKIKKNENPDNIISFSDGPNLVNILSGGEGKVIISSHNQRSNLKNEDSFLQYIYRTLYSFFYPKSDLIICVSEGVRKDLVDNFNIPKSKIKVIYNSVDINKVDNLSKNKLHAYKKIFNYPTIINVGRLTTQKGQWHLIRSFKKVKDAIPEAKLIILGDGELKKKLIKFSKKNNLKVFSVWGDSNKKNINKNDVFFLGFQNNPFKFIAKSDVFAFSSLWEGFGLVLIEAAACKTALISSDCKSGPREILAPNTGINKKLSKPERAKFGILMPFSSDLDLENKIIRKEEKIWSKELINLLEEKKLRKEYSKLAFKRSKDFSIKTIINKWKELLN